MNRLRPHSKPQQSECLTFSPTTFMFT